MNDSIDVLLPLVGFLQSAWYGVGQTSVEGAATDRIIVTCRSDDPSEIATAIEAAFPDYGEVWSIIPDSSKKFLTWFEVYRIFLEGVRAAADHYFVDGVAAIMLAYFKRRFDSGKNNRPKYGAILGPDGKVVRSFVLKERDGEPEDKTEEDKTHPPMLPPEIPPESEEPEPEA